jgi:6-pyruvoyltetrahydropterin/6-carboxytetrahydropterin synthase
MKATVCRKERFNSAHRLFVEDWSKEQNDEIFGKCNNPNYHGHNYELVVKVTGEIDSKTGYVMDMKVLSQYIKEEVIKKYDHRNLNLDTEEFKNLNPTAENIAAVIFKNLRAKIDVSFDLKICLYETEKNFVEFPA